MHIERVPVTPVPGATVVQPDEQTTLTAGNATFTFPTVSRARTFQALVIEDSGACYTAAEIALAVYRLYIYSAEGERESGVQLISPVRIEIALDAESLSHVGGVAALLQAHALGGVALLVTDEESALWSGVYFELDAHPDGTAIVRTQLTLSQRLLGGRSGRQGAGDRLGATGDADTDSHSDGDVRSDALA